MKKHSHSPQSAFTLLEMLLVIAIIAILASIVIIAINPGRQLAQARNAQRTSDLNTLDKAMKQFYVDKHYWPASTTYTSSMQEICDNDGLDSSGATDCLDFSELVPTYITAIPTDPSATTGTKYHIAIPASNQPQLASASSTEYSLEGITIATSTDVVAGLGAVAVVDACGTSGDETDPDCWSAPSTDLTWGPKGVTTGVTSTTLGAANTADLVALAGSYPAAEYCDSLSEGDHNDWYLPAKDQIFAGLTEFQTQFNAGNTTWGGFAGFTYYWSSTEDSSNYAWYSFYDSYGGDYVYTIDVFKDDSEDTTVYARCLR